MIKSKQPTLTCRTNQTNNRQDCAEFWGFEPQPQNAKAVKQD